MRNNSGSTQILKSSPSPFLAALLALALSVGAGAKAAPQPAGRGLTLVDGIKVGHHTLTERPTGCTVILVDGAGGSAFGLDAAQGVVKYLDEHNIGYKTRAGVVPIVPAAILFDLGFGNDLKIRPTADCGYTAAQTATTGPVVEGNVGAGAGATVGKLGGVAEHPGYPGGKLGPMQAGIGSAAITVPNGLVVSAIVAVNGVGDIIDPDTGRVVAGVRNADNTLADARKFSALARSHRRLVPAKTRPASSRQMQGSRKIRRIAWR